MMSQTCSALLDLEISASNKTQQLTIPRKLCTKVYNKLYNNIICVLLKQL